VIDSLLQFFRSSVLYTLSVLLSERNTRVVDNSFRFTNACLILSCTGASFVAMKRVPMLTPSTPIIEDQYLRAHGIGDLRGTNPRGYDIRKRYSQLYFQFKPEKQFWIVYVINRKFWIAFSALMFRGNPTFQLSMVLLVWFWAFVSQVMNRPFMSTGERPIILKRLDKKAERGIEDPEFAYYKALQGRIQECVLKAKVLERNKNINLWNDEDNKLGKQSRKLDRQRGAQMYFFRLQQCGRDSTSKCYLGLIVGNHV